MESHEIQQTPKVIFLNIEHSPQKAEEVWNMAKDADILLVENTGASESDKMDVTRIVRTQKYLPDSESKQKMIEEIRSEGSFFYQIAANAIANRKELYIVDTTPEGPGTAEKAESDNSRDSAEDNFFKGNFKESFEQFKKYLEMQTAFNQIRDRLVADQVKSLLAVHGEEWYGKTIAVIQGMHHTRTYHHFKKEKPEISSSRLFPEKNPTFLLTHEAEAQISRANPGVENLVQKLYLERFFVSRFLTFKSPQDLLKADNFVRSLGQDEIDSIFTRLFAMDEFIHSSQEQEPVFLYSYISKHLKDIRDELSEKYNLFVEKK